MAPARRFLAGDLLGALTGNPRIRKRAALLGRLQVGEFSSIVGLIRRAQTVYGRVFTVSGVVCAFRKRALAAAGWWSPAALTDDVEVTWRIQLAGWQVAFEAKALCWLLQTLTAVVGLPLALMRSKQARGAWNSPDRGIR